MEFIGIDEGKQQLLRGCTGEDNLRWVRSLEGFPLARAMQRISAEEILVGYNRGYFIARISDGEIIRSCDRWKGITSAHRDPSGQTVLTGLNLEGRRGICVVSLNGDDEVTEVRNRRGTYVRLNTPLDSEHFLLSVNRRILEVDGSLNTIRQYRSRGFLHAWKAMPLKDGSVLVSAGYGAFMARFSPDGRIQQRFGTKNQVSPEVQPFFYASFAVDESGIFVANWQNHGPGNGHKGRQLLKFTLEGDYLEGWSWPDDISSLQGLLLLDRI